MRQGRLQFAFFLFGLGLTASVTAQDHTRDSLLPSFKFQASKDFLNPNLSSTLDSEIDRRSGIQTAKGESRLRRYDAIFYYPLHRQGMTIDLGVNIRLQEDVDGVNQASTPQYDWLNIDPKETKTRIHAAAVFDLPFNGLKAGVSGSYEPSIENFGYDYQAKLSYKWKSGLGLEGGWQHQQKPLEQQNLNETLDEQTLFLDLNYRF